jgi:hypothetical protein
LLTDDPSVPKVLILAPHADVRDLVCVVEDAGHEPVLDENGGLLVDAMLLEPASPTLRRTARRVLESRPQTALVCVSIDPPNTASSSLRPAVHVLKPFSLGELKQALPAVLG